MTKLQGWGFSLAGFSLRRGSAGQGWMGPRSRPAREQRILPDDEDGEKNGDKGVMVLLRMVVVIVMMVVALTVWLWQRWW